MDRKKKAPNVLFDKRTLNVKEKAERGIKAAKLRIDADAREARLSANGSAERKRIKEIRAEAHEYEVQVSQGYELVEARTLFTDKNMNKLAGAKKGNGKADDKKKGASQKGVSNVDDISRAAAADKAASATAN